MDGDEIIVEEEDDKRKDSRNRRHKVQDDEIPKLRKENQTFQRRIEVLKQRVENCLQSKKKLDEELERLKLMRKRESSKTRENVANEIEGFKSEIGSLQRKLKEAQKKGSDHEAEKRGLEKELAQCRTSFKESDGPGPQGRVPEVVTSGQRMAILADVHHLYHSAKKVHNSKISYQKLLELTVRNRQLVRAIAYILNKNGPEQEQFLEILRNIGFEVRTRTISEGIDGVLKEGWDMGMALDAVAIAERLDVIVLATGDPDFIQLAEMLKARGVRVEVAAFRETASESLIQCVSAFIPLTEKALY